MLFLFLHFYNWLWTLFCSCLYFKWQYLCFCKLNHFAYSWKRCEKGRKSSGKRGGKQGKCWQELPFSSCLTANPKFLLFQRVLWACTTLSHGPELVTLQRWGENMQDNKLYLGVDAPFISLTAGRKHTPPDHTHVNWKWFNNCYLGKIHLCLFGRCLWVKEGSSCFPSCIDGSR